MPLFHEGVYDSILSLDCLKGMENIEELKIDIDENDKAIIAEVFAEKTVNLQESNTATGLYTLDPRAMILE